jgi:hypothetical protein
MIHSLQLASPPAPILGALCVIVFAVAVFAFLFLMVNNKRDTVMIVLVPFVGMVSLVLGIVVAINTSTVESRNLTSFEQSYGYVVSSVRDKADCNNNGTCQSELAMKSIRSPERNSDITFYATDISTGKLYHIRMITTNDERIRVLASAAHDE